MTLSNDVKKFISVIIWGAYLVVFLCPTILIIGLIGNINISNNFVSNNQTFFASLFSCWLVGLLLILIIPKKYRDLGYKLLLATAILLSVIYSLPGRGIWRAGDGLFLNIQWMVYVVASILAHLSIVLLGLSVLEYWFKSNLKKPILTNNKIMVTLVIIAVVSLLITYGFSFVGLPHEWII